MLRYKNRYLINRTSFRLLSQNIQNHNNNNGIVGNIKDASESTANDIRDLFQEMRKRRYNTTRVKIALGLVGVGLIVGFYEGITDFLSERATDVTHKSLEDPQFIEDATVFGTTIGKQIVKNLSEDPEVEQIFSDFFQGLFTSDPIKSAANDLAHTVVRSVVNDIEHDVVRNEATALAKERIIQLFQDPKVVSEASDFMWKSFKGAVWKRD